MNPEVKCAGTCDRILVPQRTWAALSAARREQLYRTHCGAKTSDTCQRCLLHGGRAHELAFRGATQWNPSDWEKDRHGIWRPKGPRPVDPIDQPKDDPQPIKHGTDSGYTVHRRRNEKPCDECKRAHSRAVARYAEAA